MKSGFCPNWHTPQKDCVCVLQQAYVSRLQARFPEKYQKMNPNLSKNVYVQTWITHHTKCVRTLRQIRVPTYFQQKQKK